MKRVIAGLENYPVRQTKTLVDMGERQFEVIDRRKLAKTLNESGEGDLGDERLRSAASL